jgi:ribosome-associated heat shock protein Hsp15
LRVDRFLFFIRLVKSRTLAQALVEEGHVRIDGVRAVKPSAAVREGAVIALPLHGKVRVIEVVALPARRGPAGEAQRHYREIFENASQQSAGD